MNQYLVDALSKDEQARLAALDSPAKIQAYLDSLPYRAEELDRSPLQVWRDGQCHCLDGALFAAAALRRLGFPARVIDLVPEPGADDDHVLALYQVDGCTGRWPNPATQAALPRRAHLREGPIYLKGISTWKTADAARLHGADWRLTSTWETRRRASIVPWRSYARSNHS